MMKRKDIRDYGLLVLGAVVQAASMDLFFIPGQIASGGVSGLAQVLNQHTGLPIGMMVLVMNVPLFVLGWRYLGGRRFLIRTILTVALYSVLVDLGRLLIPVGPTGTINRPRSTSTL